jgi:DNA-binding LytR/AlgR family response regulator
MKNRTILLVEDDFLNRRLSRKILSESNYFIFEAKNTKETLEILKKENIDLVILDINLGENEQDGISLGQQIQERFSIPFIYLTAYENLDIIDRAISTEPYSYLTKPFKNSDLIASVEIAIRQSSMKQKSSPFILVKDGEYNIELPVQTVNYFESEGNYLLVYTDEKQYKMRSTIKDILDILSSSFVQIHRAYIVNKDKIEKFNTKEVIVKNTVLPISKNYLDNI